MEPRVTAGRGCVCVYGKKGVQHDEPPEGLRRAATTTRQSEQRVASQPSAFIHGIMGGLFYARPALVCTWRLSLPLGLVDAGDDPERP